MDAERFSNQDTSSSVIEVDDVAVEQTCGYRLPYTCSGKEKTFLVKKLQRFAKPHWALGVFSSVGFLQGFVVSGLINVVLTTIEKRFGFSSAEAGLILSSYNIASCIVIPIISYLGGRGNKPVWIGWGISLMGLGCLLFASPHLFAESYQVTYDSIQNELICLASNVTVDNANQVADISYFKYVFQFAHVLNGIGTAALLTLGMTYLDENVEQKDSSMYHGIYFAIAAAFGPAAGYVIGGYTLNVFTVISKSPNLTPNDSAWVGAWWMGFVVCGILLVLLSVPIMLFPPTMPGTRNLHTNRSKEMHQNSLAKIADKDDNFGKNMKDLPKFILVLLKNPAFLLVSFANALDFGLISGMSAFTPKYLESMFGLTPTTAAYYLGIAVILGGSMGYIFGGLIVSKAELTVTGMMRMCCISTMAALGCSVIYLYSCPNIDFAGATVPYTNHTTNGGDGVLSSINFTSQCNDECNCNTNSYEPVCGSNGVTYFSSCFAGCKHFINGTYTNCSCIEGGNYTATAKKGACSNTSCNSLPGFMISLFGLLFFTVLCWTPVLQIVLRVIPFKQRSFAVGAQWVLNRGVGGIPIPIVFGRVYDLTCAVWSGSSVNNDQGSCRLYSNFDMSRYTLYLILGHKIVTLICYILGTIFYKPTEEARASSSKKKLHHAPNNTVLRKKSLPTNQV